MNIYATATDLAGWIDPSAYPAGTVTERLRSASLLVATATLRNPYDPNIASDPNLPVLRDATCAQAAAWLRAGLDPVGGVAALSGSKKSVGIGTASVSYDTPSVEMLAAALAQLAPDAYALLYGAGLLVQALPFWDGADQSLIPDWTNQNVPYSPSALSPPPWGFL